jgi:hypothetical protein
MARTSLGGGPIYPPKLASVLDKAIVDERKGAPSTVFWYADGHPTFLVLLNARRLGVRDEIVDLLLIHHQLTIRQSLCLDDLALRHITVPGTVDKLTLESADLGTDLTATA